MKKKCKRTTICKNNLLPKKDYMLLVQLYELLAVDPQQLMYSQPAHLFPVSHQTQPLMWTGDCSILNKIVDLSFCSLVPLKLPIKQKK